MEKECANHEGKSAPQDAAQGARWGPRRAWQIWKHYYCPCHHLLPKHLWATFLERQGANRGHLPGPPWGLPPQPLPDLSQGPPGLLPNFFSTATYPPCPRAPSLTVVLSLSGKKA